MTTEPSPAQLVYAFPNFEIPFCDFLSGSIVIDALFLLLQVRVVPLGTIERVGASTSRTGPFTVDDVIELVGCEASIYPYTHA